MKTYNELLELITRTIIRRKDQGRKWVKPESVYPEYLDDYNFDEYERFNQICYEMEKNGLIKIETRIKFRSEKEREEKINSTNQPMIRKIIFVDGAEEKIVKTYLKAKNENMKNKNEK